MRDHWGLLGFVIWLGGILAYIFLPWLRAPDPALFMAGWGLVLFYLGIETGKHHRW